MAKTNEIATKADMVSLASPKAAMEFATNLKDLVVQNQLCTEIKGKNYVNVEGWQIAGAFMGTFPIVEKVENLSEGFGKYKYRAEVSLQDKDGNKVGYGVAICTNQEPGKKNFDEYAVASMAQTRAVGKAFRMKIGWLLKIAGYETTPAEEMPVIDGETVNEPKKPSLRDISYAKSRLEQAKTMNELKTAFVAIGEIRDNPEVIAVKDAMKAKISAKEAEIAGNGDKDE